MSEWVYIGASYALTWTVLGVYALYLHGRTRQAREALRGAARAAEVER